MTSPSGSKDASLAPASREPGGPPGPPGPPGSPPAPGEHHRQGRKRKGDRGRDRAVYDHRRAELPTLLDRLPPHAIEAEMSLLGSMMLDMNVIGDVVQVLSGPDDFYVPKHGTIYAQLVHLYDRNQPIDMVHLKQRLTDLGVLEQVGGLDYLLELGYAVPSAATAAYYAKMVRDKSIIRRLIDTAGNILVDAYTSADSVDELLDMAEQDIFELAERKDTSEAKPIGVLAQEAYEYLEALEGRNITGLETGFYDLDEMTSGLQKGEMIIIAARPSMGKTAFALNIAEHAAIELKRPTALFSLEMSKQQLAQRLMCSRTAVDSHKMRRNMLGADDFEKLALCVGELADAPLHIDDSPGLTLLALRAKARRLAQKHDIEMIVIDYLQLMSAPGAESRQQEVSNMSRGIKALARELNCPVVCLSQLNRGPESREGHRPRMSDLRESGSIEQDADVVMMLHREEYYHINNPEWAEKNPDKVGVAELILAKQRNGPTGTVQMHFSPSTTRFHNLMRGGGGGGM